MKKEEMRKRTRKTMFDKLQVATKVAEGKGIPVEALLSAQATLDGIQAHVEAVNQDLAQVETIKVREEEQEEEGDGCGEGRERWEEEKKEGADAEEG
jgi:hypothetical protein